MKEVLEDLLDARAEQGRIGLLSIMLLALLIATGIKGRRRKCHTIYHREFGVYGVEHFRVGFRADKILRLRRAPTNDDGGIQSYGSDGSSTNVPTFCGHHSTSFLLYKFWWAGLDYGCDIFDFFTSH